MREKAPTEKFQPSKEDIKAWSADLDRMSKSDELEDVMRAFACIVDHFDEFNMDRLFCRTYRKALDWLQTLKSRIEAVKLVEYEAGTADSDGCLVRGTEHTMYMAYSTDVISDEDAGKILEAGRADMDPRVVQLWPSQAAALFPAVREGSEGNAEGE